MERHTYIRIAKIDAAIRRREYPNCRKLAEEFEVSQRTILRDIEAMKDSLGAPLRYSKERNGYYYEGEEFSLPAVRLTEGEIISMFLGAEVLKKYKNTPFAPAIQQALTKVELLLPKEISIDFKELGGIYSFDIEQTKELDKRAAGVFEILTKAIKGKTSVEVDYYAIGRDALSKRIIDPYHLRHTLGAWYLVGYCHFRKDVRTFSVNQIRSIKTLPDKFTIQKDFSPEKFFADSWEISEGKPLTKVAVKLDISIARWFRDRRLHPSQQTKENKDGSLTLTFKVAGTSEIKRWILSQGYHAKVLEPRGLREEIREEAKKILSQTH